MRQTVNRGLLLASAATGIAGLLATPLSAHAQGGGNEIVVTGSYIAGTPETAALPVDVIGVDELERRGNPSTVELMKSLSVSSGVQGDQNQYSSATSPIAGLATVNLRGLGSTRTLVLLNGRRLVTHPSRNGPVDLNTLPMVAVGRVEVLKDGAAATYGSDAIGGVVNFITRKNFDGLLLSGSTRYVPEAEDPDLDASALWGWQGDNGDLLIGAGWQKRGRLRSNKRDWNLRSYTENPDAGYSFTNNPTSFRPVVGGALQTQIRDPGCQTVGALAGVVGGNAVCLARLAGTFVNIVDPSSRCRSTGRQTTTSRKAPHFTLRPSTGNCTPSRSRRPAIRAPSAGRRQTRRRCSPANITRRRPIRA